MATDSPNQGDSEMGNVNGNGGTTAIATQQKKPDSLGYDNHGGMKLTTLDEVWRLSGIILQSNMAPRDFDTREKITVALMWGGEIGLAPMQAVNSIAVINNRPALWGDALPALVLGSGKCKEFEEWFTGTGDSLTAHCRTHRVGMSKPHETTFSVEDAKIAKLWGKTSKEGKPTPWVTSPKRMLQLRARGFNLRDRYSDVLRGFGIAEEEMDIERPVYQPQAAVKPKLIDLDNIPEETAAKSEDIQDAEVEETDEQRKARLDELALAEERRQFAEQP